MANKKLIGLVIAAIVVVGGGIGGYFIWKGAQPEGNGDDPLTWDEWYPEAAIPDANLTFVKAGEDDVVVSLDTIFHYLNDSVIPKKEFTEEIEGTDVEMIGFNPVDLYDVVGWNDADYVKFEAGDGYSKSINATEFMLSDPEYNKAASGYPAVLVIIANTTWLDTWDSDYGDFAIRGFESSSVKIKDVVKLTYESGWKLAIEIDGEVEFYLDNLNITTAFTNYTDYDWGYYDEEDGYGWDEANHEGVTVASIVEYCETLFVDWDSLTDYNVSAIAFDGWGEEFHDVYWKYNKTDVEDGLTADHSINITTGGEEVLLDNEGKQMMICNVMDEEALDHDSGPFRIIIPGQSKQRFVHGLTTLRFETDRL